MKTRIRIENIDAAEIHQAQCADELTRGEAARARLVQLLAAGDVDLVRQGRKDRYGRAVAWASIAGADIGEALISEGLARRWDGRRRPWCTG